MEFLFLGLYSFLVLLPVRIPQQSFQFSLSLILTHSHFLSLTHSLSRSHSLSHSLAHSHTHSLGLRCFCVAAWDNVLCQGVGYTPWRSSGSASFGWQVWDNVQCQGVRCTSWRPSGSASFAWQAWDNEHSNGSDVRPGVPRAPSLLRAGVGQCALPKGRMYALVFCVAGVGQCAPPRGQMHVLASSGSASFASQAWDNVHWQGVGYMP